MKKIFGAVFCIMFMIACPLGLFACGDGGDGGGNNSAGGVKTYIMEAEYINLDGLVGAGLSNEATGVGMIFGEGNEADIAKGWSSGYFIGCNYSAGLSFEFKFNSDAAETAAVILRLGSEIGDITLTPEIFAVRLNGTAINYGSISVTGSAIDVLSFYDKTITANVPLSAGENTITLVVLNNTLLSGRTGAPMIDCVKIKTNAAITFTEKKDNPGRRGEI